MGLIKELGKTVFEQVCKYISEKELVTSEIKRVHINLKRQQLEDMEYVKEYAELLKQYHIPGKFICIEVTIDHRADYKALEHAFGTLRGYGVSFLLDQFGASANNMKDWAVVLDGVEEKIWFEKLEKLDCAYLQGAYIEELYENRKSDSEEEEIGGVLVG